MICITIKTVALISMCAYRYKPGLQVPSKGTGVSHSRPGVFKPPSPTCGLSGEQSV